MRLGIMSDSHGRVSATRRALALLTERGASAFVHCGDVGSLEVLEELAGRRAWFVWGNTDFLSPGWEDYVRELGFELPRVPLELELAGRRIAVCHGHEPEFRRISAGNSYDYVLFGHSHRRADERVGSMRLINPGALHRASPKTCALLDLDRDELEFLELDG